MNRKYPIIILIIAISLVLFNNCAEEPTPSLYDPNYTPTKPNPEIGTVEPAEGTYAGIGEVTISGENFSNAPEDVHVYFDGVKAELVSTSETKIEVIAPVVANDSVTIKIRVDGALLFAEYSPYKLEVAVREYGGINYVSDAYGVACDLNENLYLSLGEFKIIKVTPDEEQVDYVTEAQGVDGFYGAMKMGPGGQLYAARTRFLYRVPAGGDTIIRVSGRLSKRPTDLDFDQYGNILYSATGGIYLVRADFTDSLIAEYPDISLSSIRIYNNAVYVAGLYTGTGSPDTRIGVWRNAIVGQNGELGSTEEVFDLEAYYNNQPGVPVISAITFAEDGELYIGVDSTDISEAITVVAPEGDSYPLENARSLYDVLLIPPASVFCWGTDQYLYMNRRSKSDADKVLLRLTMGKNTAPYYGRQ